MDLRLSVGLCKSGSSLLEQLGFYSMDYNGLLFRFKFSFSFLAMTAKSLVGVMLITISGSLLHTILVNLSMNLVKLLTFEFPDCESQGYLRGGNCTILLIFKKSNDFALTLTSSNIATSI